VLRHAAGNPEPLGRLVAWELPATFFSPRGDVTTGTRDVWARYERDTSSFTSGSENAFEALDSAANGDITYWVGCQRSTLIHSSSRRRVNSLTH
jgi:hypothetical protein